MSNDHWNTPEPILEPLYDFLGGFFSLDPCSNHRSRVLSEHRYTRRENGLVQPWFGSVFMNPPYSRGNLDLWVARASLWHDRRETEHIFGLVPAYTSSAWWHESATRATSILFYDRRIRFLGATGSPMFPSALLYFGPQPQRFQLHLQPFGWIVHSSAWRPRRDPPRASLLPSLVPHTPSLPSRRFVN